MNPLGPQRKKVGESRSVTCWETNSPVRRPLRPFQVGSGCDRHTSYLKLGRDLLKPRQFVFENDVRTPCAHNTGASQK